MKSFINGNRTRNSHEGFSSTRNSSNFIVNDFLKKNSLSLEEVAETFAPCISQGMVDEVASKVVAVEGKQQDGIVDPIVSEIFQRVLPEILHRDPKNIGRYIFHTEISSYETADKSSSVEQKVMDFDIHVTQLGAATLVLPTGLKFKTYSSQNEEMLLTLSRLMERLLDDFELLRDEQAHVFGYCVSTYYDDGHHLAVGHIDVDNGMIVVNYDAAPTALLWPMERIEVDTLEQKIDFLTFHARGFLYLLALLDSTNIELGLNEFNPNFCNSQYTAVRVLGVGTFCAAVEVTQSDHNERFVMKV